MKMASVPDWVVSSCGGNAVRLYALLDLRDGQLAVVTGSEITGLSRGTVQRALKELRDGGAIKRVANARYELRRDPPVSNHVREQPGLSTSSTEFSTGASTGDRTVDASPADESGASSTFPQDLLATTRGHGDKGQEGNPSLHEEPAGEPVPKTLLVSVEGFERKQNLGFNALAEECDADPRTRSAEISAALNGSRSTGIGIRACVWQEAQEAVAREVLSAQELVLGVRGGEAFERLVVIAIKHRAKLYRRRLRGATLTPTALAKWWFDVEKLPEQGLSSDEIASGAWRDS